MADNQTYDMTKGSPAQLLLRFSIPMLIGNLFQQFYNMVDAMIVGNFVGANALGAVGATGSINFLFFSLNSGLAAGIGVIIAQYFGAKDDRMVRKGIAASIYLMLGASILMGILGVIVAWPIMELLETPDAIISDAVLYMQINCAGLIAVAAYNGIASILRALGDSKTPLFFLIIASILNVGLDLLFVLAFQWGVMGVGIATILAQAAAAAGCIYYVWKKVSYFHITKEELKLDKPLLYKCMRLGIPVSLQMSMISVSCIALQWVVNGFGETIVAAFTAANRVEQLVQQPFNSLGTAVATFTGQNVGANQKERVKKGFWVGLFISTIFSVCMMPVAIFGADWMMRLFTSEPEVIAIGAKGIQITCFFYMALGAIYVSRNVLNGVGDAKFAMLSGGIEVFGRVGFAKPLTMISGIGMWGIWLTTGLTWVITGLAGCLRYLYGKWRQ